MGRRLSRSFFERDTRRVAQELLGKHLMRWYRGKVTSYIITETEAYHGYSDRASHAHKGITDRTAPMFGRAGHAYVYLIYGMYYCFNIVTGRVGYPAAVLIRGVERANARIEGPGKLCQNLKITKSLNKHDLITSRELWIEYAPPLSYHHIIRGPRVGVDYAGDYAHRPWRYRAKNNIFL